MNSGVNPDFSNHNEKPDFIWKHYFFLKQVSFTTLYFKADWDESVVKIRFGEEDDSLSDFATENAKAWKITVWENINHALHCLSFLKSRISVWRYPRCLWRVGGPLSDILELPCLGRQIKAEIIKAQRKFTAL